MTSERKETIGAKFRTAGSSGRKVHIISREGQWAVFKEGADRVLSEFVDKKSAVLKAKEILESGKVEALVLHKADGSVEKIMLGR